MEATIWTKTAKNGTVIEISRTFIRANGKSIGSPSRTAGQLPKWIVKDGVTYTHVISGLVAITTEEAASYDAAMAADFAELRKSATYSYAPNAADRSEDLSREMARENSAL